METARSQGFRLRRDRNGFRPVFALGNTLGYCPIACTFCSVQARSRVTPEEAGHRFDSQLEEYLGLIDGPYHPVIYNQGNVTNPLECPTELLDHILETFRSDSRVRFVSINSREVFATSDVLGAIAAKSLPYPVHFIFGQESFSPRAAEVIGKRVDGEFLRFLSKLEPFNDPGLHVFGIDVSLLFLPELHLRAGESRGDRPDAGADGLARDVSTLLAAARAAVPLQVNIHPFTRVEDQPWEDADLESLLRALPHVQQLVDQHNARSTHAPVHLFLGAEGIGYGTTAWQAALAKWREAIDQFNLTGCLPSSAGYEVRGGSTAG